MAETNAESIVIFWSWQTDSPSQENRNFIEDCLKRAAKKAGKAEARLISVDRDTQGVGGTPGIAETILAKIRSSDIFVWDATLVYAQPRPAPNPNVVLELGYALAVMGEGRLIGIMNTAGRPGPEFLPFDLRHRRWPINYALQAMPRLLRYVKKLIPGSLEQYYAVRRSVRDKLVSDLEQAIRAALQEPKLGALRSDVDLQAAQNLWRIISSGWILDWHEFRMTHPQFEDDDVITRFSRYIRLAERPENAFGNMELKSLHEQFTSRIEKYLYGTAIEMQPHTISGKYVISVKASDRYIKNYDEEYERQVKVIRDGVRGVWSAWGAYVQALRERYPEVTSQPDEE